MNAISDVVLLVQLPTKNSRKEAAFLGALLLTICIRRLTFRGIFTREVREINGLNMCFFSIEVNLCVSHYSMQIAHFSKHSHPLKKCSVLLFP